MPQIDSLGLVLVSAGVLLAIAAAVLVGSATARLFFHASEGEIEDDGGHVVTSRPR